jgi:sugar lactone lactonase YvrE
MLTHMHTLLLSGIVAALMVGSIISGCTVERGFFEGLPCDENETCASGYTCLREACGEGFLCSVCRQNPASTDGGADADGGIDAGDAPGDQPLGCHQAPPPCKSLPDCQDISPECVDGVWLCGTAYESPERSCDFLDNDCDGQTDTGLVCRLAGEGLPGFVDGSAGLARFDHPRSLLSLPSGAVLVADQGNHAIRQVEQDGSTTTLAGGQAGYQDGQGDQARFRNPMGMALYVDGTVLVADRLNHRIRQVSAGGETTTLAGSGFVDYLDGPLGEAQFAFPSGLAVDDAGAILVADTGNHCIRLIDQGQVSTFAGRCEYPGLADGPAAEARFNSPTDLLILADGRLLVSEESAHRIRAVAPDGTVTTLAGDGQFGFLDGALAEARFANPAGLVEDPDLLRFYLADAGNHRIRQLAEQVTTLAGQGMAGNADGPPPLVEFNRPGGLAFLGDGRLVISDTNNHLLRVMSP